MKIEMAPQFFHKRSAYFPGNLFSGMDGFQLALIWDLEWP